MRRWGWTLALAAIAATSSALADIRRPAPWAITYTAVPITVGATHIFGVEGVNDELYATGYSRVGKIMPNLSIAVTGAFSTRLVVEPQYRFSIVSSKDVTLTVHHFLINSGYLVYARDETFLYPFLGFGLGNAQLELARHLGGQSFDEALASPSNDALLESSAIVLHGGVAANLWGSGHGDFIGLRTGIVHAPGDRAWKRRGADIYDGPKPPMGGAYFALAVGFRGPGVRQRPPSFTGRR